MSTNLLIRSATKFTGAVNGLSRFFGKTARFLTLLLVLVTVWDVALRYLFHAGSVAVQELEWHIFGVIILLGAAYSVQRDEHVRVDVFYNRYSPRQKAWVDLFGILFFLLPFSIVALITTIPMVERAILFSEGSAHPGGLPYRFLIKAMIPLGFGLLTLQGLSWAVALVMKLFTTTEEAGDV